MRTYNPRDPLTVTKRTEVLELAVLGLLHDSPMHGYELRKQLTALLGWGRSLSYGSLYPALKDLVARGMIAASDADSSVGRSRRAKIVYELTADGKEHFAELISQAGPTAWEDEPFGVHFAFFARTDAETRMRILEGRRSRLEERLATFRTSLQKTRERLDAYTLELQKHGLESVEREVRWLDELIDNERHSADARPTTAGQPGTKE